MLASLCNYSRLYMYMCIVSFHCVNHHTWIYTEDVHVSYIVLEVDTRLKSGWNVRSDIFVNIELLPNKKKSSLLKTFIIVTLHLLFFKNIYTHIYSFQLLSKDKYHKTCFVVKTLPIKLIRLWWFFPPRLCVCLCLIYHCTRQRCIYVLTKAK